MASGSLLHSKDSIMEVHVLNNVAKFIADGGTPQAAIQALSDNYRGYAQMSNLLTNWLTAAQVEDGRCAQRLTIHHLKTMIMQRFDPKEADSLFSVQTSEVPKWLEELIKEKEWRGMVYELAEKHRQCVLLSFAIELIAQAGYQNEIASVSTATANFSVFRRIMTETLVSVLSEDEDQLLSHIDEFRRTICSRQFTYLYAQALLYNLSSHDRFGRQFRRISQELSKGFEGRALLQSRDAEVVTSNGSRSRVVVRIVDRMNTLLSDLHNYPDIFNSISCIIADSNTNTADINKLYSAYTSATPPPTRFICEPVVIDLLMRDLFDPSRPLYAADREKYIYLLAAACSSDESSLDSDADSLKEVILALTQLHTMCRIKIQSYIVVATSMVDMVHIPIICQCVLFWSIQGLRASQTYSGSLGSVVSPPFLALLKIILTRHPLLRPRIFELLTTCFELTMEPDATDALTVLEARKKLLHMFLSLSREGFILPVLRYLTQRSVSIDHALLRYFIRLLLSLIQPPYSRPLVQHVSELLVQPQAQQALHTEEYKTVVHSFADHCVSCSAQYQLDAHDLQKLQPLQTPTVASDDIRLSPVTDPSAALE